MGGLVSLDGKSKKFQNSGGVSSYVDFLRGRKTALCQTVVCEGGQDGITVEVAMQWNDSYNESVLCYTNNIPQKDGGTHLSGFRSSLTRVLKAYIKKEELSEVYINNMASFIYTNSNKLFDKE